MTTFARDVTCPGCAKLAIRIVVDDGREPEASDAETMRIAAAWVAAKHGGWRCSDCGFVMGLSTELLEELHALFTVA